MIYLESECPNLSAVIYLYLSFSTKEREPDLSPTKNRRLFPVWTYQNTLNSSTGTVYLDQFRIRTSLYPLFLSLTTVSTWIKSPNIGERYQRVCQTRVKKTFLIFFFFFSPSSDAGTKVVSFSHVSSCRMFSSLVPFHWHGSFRLQSTPSPRCLVGLSMFHLFLPKLFNYLPSRM